MKYVFLAAHHSAQFQEQNREAVNTCLLTCRSEFSFLPRESLSLEKGTIICQALKCARHTHICHIT